MRFTKLLREQNWAGFALDFLAVVLGIVLTFVGEALITSYNEQEDVKNSLQLVRDELIDNLDNIHSVDSLLNNDALAAEFLIRYMEHYDDAPLDTLYQYCNVPMYIYSFSISSQALELLKNSSIFSKIKDKSLALNIIHAYGNLDEYKQSKDFYFQKKQSLIDAAITDDMKKALSQPNITAQKFWKTLTSTTNGTYLLHEIRISNKMKGSTEEIINNLNTTIESIESYCK